jgi:transposase
LIRVELNAEQREELRKRSHERGIAPRTRDRLEMVRLADAGWSIPRIARHLGYHEQTVRKYIKLFVAGGFDRLPDKPHLGRTPKVTEEMLLALERLIDESDRTWTTPQLAKWSCDHSAASWLDERFRVEVHPDHLARLLHKRRFRWKRTKRSVAHKRKDPDLQVVPHSEAVAGPQAAKEAELEVIEKSGPGR